MIKAIDVFSGCGGLSCGLTLGGFNVKSALEIDSQVVVLYKKYQLLSKVNVLNKDICDTKGYELLNAAKIKKNDIYLLAGCPPCQYFSSQNRQNKKKTTEEKKKLLMEFLRIIKETYPPFILMENVPGIKTADNGVILEEFIDKLSNECSSNRNEQYFILHGILNAADYGVPQARKRFVLHAVRRDIFNLMTNNQILFSLPKPTHSKDGKLGLPNWVTVWETISDLPEIKAGEKYRSGQIKNHYAANLSEINLQRMEQIRKNDGNRTSLPDNLILDCHKEYQGHKDVYGIMRKDQPAPTITGGCTNYTKGRFGHPTQNRAISVREAARLQTFPDDFIFDESVTKAALEIGNAVPVKLVEESAKQLIRIMKKVQQLSID